MSGKGRGRKPRSGLTAEEQALWEHAAKSMTPLAKAKSRVPDGTDEFLAAMEPEPPRRRAAKGEAVALPGLPAAPAPPAKPKRTPELADFDRKSAKRLRGGQIEIEARIDLHGMRADEAHDALARFLSSCQAQGKRWVLVITGKGAPRRSAWVADDAPPRDDFGRNPPGVIRRSVPGWLGAADLRAIVVSYTHAAIQHGGEGALYVQLRKRG
jgi:DNA-nicking Smr family endonuclease